MLIEGKNSVYEELTSGATVNKLLVLNIKHDEMGEKIISLARERGIKITFVNRQALDNLSVNKKHQGFIVDVTDFVYSEIEDILVFAKSRNEDPFVVISDGIEDPHNLGNIIRTCECAGVHGIIIPKQRGCPINSTVIKVSSGAAAHVKIARVTNIHAAQEELKKHNIWVYAADMNGTNIYKTKLTGAIAIIVGSEGKGIGELTRKKSDGIISLPMFGKINSLNAGNAACAVLYEVIRQRLETSKSR